jgi:hypothetical protein
MGELYERLKLNKLVKANDIPNYFKQNCLEFYQRYFKTDDYVKLTPLKNIIKGQFFFFHYLDDSNWVKWSPVFVADVKQYGTQTILLCVNFNFLPLEVRVAIFDKYITEQDFEKCERLKGKHFIKVKFEPMYNELKRMRLEYCLMEYNAIQIVKAHRIHFSLLPQFLYSQHPKNKYDPKKLIQIWKKKAETSEQRDNEMSQLTIDDLYDFNKDFTQKFSVLEGHIKRIRASIEKYGGGQ